MKKLINILIILIVVILMLAILFVAIYSQNSLQRVLNKYDITYDEVLLTRKIDDKLVFVFQNNEEQGLTLFGAISFKKTKRGFREHSFEVIDMNADIAYVNIFLNDIDAQNDVLLIGEIMDNDIENLEIEYESEGIKKVEIVEKYNRKFFLFRGETGRYSFIKYDSSGNIIGKPSE